MGELLLLQLIAHIVADFYAQPECISRGKHEYIFRSWHIYVHALVVFVMSALMTPARGFILWAGAIAVLHFGIDAAKCALERVFGQKNHRILFFADQILHLAVIWAAVLFYMRTGGAISGYCIADIFTTHDLLVFVGFLLCLKPANVFIRVCLASLPTVGVSLKDESLQKAGRWIGSMERMLTFSLVLLGEYTAIGFIIAAKSVLRYSAADKAEYVLVGTLMSFGVAFALGVGITSGVFENVINVICCNI